MWCIPPEQNAEFVCAMENVLTVYERPYDSKRPVICMDEGSKQLVKEIRVPQPVAPGQPARFDSEYERNGTASVFMFCEPLQGWRRVDITPRRTRTDWALQVRRLVDEDCRNAERITLVMDNLNTHSAASLYEALEPSEARRLIEKLEIVHTPKHGSWLNMAEIELGVLSRQCTDARIPDRETLMAETQAWQRDRNNASVVVHWQFTTKDARIKLRRLYPQVQS
jgi:DDE superfamily endonuclease